MKNWSIRTRILAGVVIVNLLGALAVVVYLHQTSSRGLDVDAERSLALGSASWSNVSELEDVAITTDDPAALIAEQDWLERMKRVTGAEYFLLIDKAEIDQTAYAEARLAANIPDNWDDLEDKVAVLSTGRDVDDEVALFTIPAGDVPEDGKMVGIENGACAATCHEGMTAEGAYWTIKWSDQEGVTSAHTVFPVNDVNGQPVGVIYSIEDISAGADAALRSVLQTLMVIGITLLAATLVIGGLLDTLIFKRLNTMIDSMEDISVRVAGGDFDAHFEPAGTTDEIGRFESFFAKFIDLMAVALKGSQR